MSDVIPPRQWRCLELILLRQASGKPVTVRWLAREMGVRINAVWGHLRGLAAKELIRSEPYQAATIRPACRFVPASMLEMLEPRRN